MEKTGLKRKRNFYSQEKVDGNGHFKKKRKIDNSQEFKKLQEFRRGLPIHPCEKSIVKEIEEAKNRVLLIVGETGSGKTTQIPQFVLKKWPNSKICVTEPRRIAAIKVSERVNSELFENEEFGKYVGYKVRFETNITNPRRTKLFFLTDGMLLREIQEDEMLKKYNTIIIDEAHERSLHTEILFGLIKRLLRKRKDLRVIVMSATLEFQKFSKYFFDCKVVYVRGRQFPIELKYLKTKIDDSLEAVGNAALQIHMDLGKKEGDILAFLHGSEEIEEVCNTLETKAKHLPFYAKKMIVTKLYSSLPENIKSESFEITPKGCRKVILSTNIAETSLTIPGVKYVIDTGLVKMNEYNPKIRKESLLPKFVSKAVAKQRMGRAGRESAGKCYRLFSEEDFFNFDEFTKPEILRCNLSSVILQMLSIGIKDIQNFEFIEKPSKETIDDAMSTLLQLGAIKRNGELSDFGKKLAIFPLDPSYGVALLRSSDLGCSDEVLKIISMLSIENIFIIPLKKREEANRAKMNFASSYGDHITYLNVFNGYMKTEKKNRREWCFRNFINSKKMEKVLEVRRQLKEYLHQIETFNFRSCGADREKIRMCFLEGFFMNIAFKGEKRGIFKTFYSNQEVRLHPSSVVNGNPKNVECIIYNSLVQTSKAFVRDVLSVDKEWFYKFTKGRNQFKLLNMKSINQMQKLKRLIEEKPKDDSKENQKIIPKKEVQPQPQSKKQEQVIKNEDKTQIQEAKKMETKKMNPQPTKKPEKKKKRKTNKNIFNFADPFSTSWEMTE